MSISSQADKHMVCRLVPPKGLAVSRISWEKNGGSEVVSVAIGLWLGQGAGEAGGQ